MMLAIPMATGPDNAPAFDHERCPNAFALMRGQRIENFRDPLAIIIPTQSAYERIRKKDYVSSGAPFPIVSTAFRELLTELCPDDVQFFYVEFRLSNIIKSKGHHFAVNVTGIFSVIDVEESVPQGFWNSASPPEFFIFCFRKIELKTLAEPPHISRISA